MHDFTVDWINGYDQNLNHIKQYLPNGFDYLEIGVAEGRSFCWVLENLKPSYAIGVDIWDKDYYGLEPESTYEKAKRNIELSQGEADWDLCREDSSSFLTFYKQGKSCSFKNFNLVYIDGSHEYEQVILDIENVVKLLTPDVIILDDYKIKDVRNAILDSYDIFREFNYILEAVNTQYVLVRRDCHANGFAVDKIEK